MLSKKGGSFKSFTIMLMNENGLTDKQLFPMCFFYIELTGLYTKNRHQSDCKLDK